MKWVVYLLLAINLGLLTWNLQEEATSTDVGSMARPPVVRDEQESKALPLLSELEQRNLRARPTQLASAAPDPSALPAAAPLSASPPPAPGTGLPPATRGTPVTTPPAPAPAGPATQSAPSITLAPNSEPDSSASAASARPQICMTLGPLEDKAAVPGIQAWLEEQGAQVDVRSDERREVALYWVFFPPRATRAAAVEQVEKMKSQGIDDVIVVPKGDMANAISLGVFSRTESRDRRLKELKGKGYQPSIGPRYRTKVATWIDVFVDDGRLDGGAIESRWPGARVTTAPCPGASPQPSPASSDTAETTAAAPMAAPRRFFFSGQSEQ